LARRRHYLDHRLDRLGGRIAKLPNQYEASARVYVDTQSILKPLLSGMTSMPNLDQQVMFMRRTLISRPNVERLMRMVDLDVKAKDTKEHEKLVDDLMATDQDRGTERDDIYTITYVERRSQAGQGYRAILLTIFVEGSFSGKKQDSDKAVQFIDDQIKNYEEKLASAENSLKEFKLKNLGMLPREGGGDYGGQLQAATDQLSQARLELAEAEQARNAIRRQIKGEPAKPGTTTIDPGVVDPELEAASRWPRRTWMDCACNTPSSIRTSSPTAACSISCWPSVRSCPKQNAPRPGRRLQPDAAAIDVSLSQAEARVASMRARVDEYAARVARLRTPEHLGARDRSPVGPAQPRLSVNRENYQKLVERRERRACRATCLRLPTC
jgi:polysaccharide chain length determinant protein (PEP-CTERM system associated)